MGAWFYNPDKLNENSYILTWTLHVSQFSSRTAMLHSPSVVRCRTVTIDSIRCSLCLRLCFININTCRVYLVMPTSLSVLWTCFSISGVYVCVAYSVPPIGLALPQPASRLRPVGLRPAPASALRPVSEYWHATGHRWAPGFRIAPWLRATVVRGSCRSSSAPAGGQSCTGDSDIIRGCSSSNQSAPLKCGHTFPVSFFFHRRIESYGTRDVTSA
jgi:hypothetical protein